MGDGGGGVSRVEGVVEVEVEAVGAGGARDGVSATNGVVDVDASVSCLRPKNGMVDESEWKEMRDGNQQKSEECISEIVTLQHSP